jgi:osomolarity two-component system response regulator SSK1
MSKLTAVRLQPLSVVPTEDLDGVAQDSPVLDLPPSNKFGFAWPYPSLSLSNDQLFSFSPSDADETDTSEAESFAPSKDEFDDGEHSTPTHNMESDVNPLEHLPTSPTSRLPLSRAFSMPLPSQLRHLRNPRRAVPSPDGEWNTRPVESSSELSHFHELSLELADSVQAAIQTLLQLSPPQLLDQAKEQLSGCSVSIPTPSLSAMFTCMKNLNYMSANMSTFSKEPTNFKPQDPGMPARSSSPARALAVETHFDIGEMLQSVGDSLSGLAAQAGIDLILFHQDVGMKHVAVKGDESGLSYTLSYVRAFALSRAHRLTKFSDRSSSHWICSSRRFC